MAFKKFTLARLIEPYRRKYIGLGSEEELNNFLNPTATSAELADPTSDINTVDKYAGKPAYDTTLGEPVWADGPLPSDGWSQASGGGGGGSALETQDNGVSLSTNTALYNFIGFNITEPVADEFDITFGAGAASNSEYCPGYTYTFVDTDTWRITGINAENLFNVGRRLKFIDGASTYFGTVTAVDFNITSAGDTTIDMSMESGDVLTNSITEVCLVTGATAWSPISDDPFGGQPINDIATGQIGSEQWYVIVGNNGQLATSTDSGLTWTLRNSNTTEDIVSVAFSVANQEFAYGATGGENGFSQDGSTWTRGTDITVSSGRGQVHVCFDEIEDSNWFCLFYIAANNPSTRYSVDSGVTWTTGDGFISSGPLQSDQHRKVKNLDGSGTSTRGLYIPGALTGVRADFSTDSTVGTFGSAYTNVINAYEKVNDGVDWNNLITVHDNGRCEVRFENGTSFVSLDDVTFTASLNAVVKSELHDRVVVVGDSANLGYIDYADLDVNDAWTFVASGFGPTVDILCVTFNEIDGIFVAGGSDGTICRSSNGTN